MAQRLVVIGGDAAGMSAAAQARRRRDSDELEVVAFERGLFTSYSACGIPYWLGGVVDGRDQLMLATGAQPVRADLPGIDAGGVHSVQTLGDAQVLRDDLDQYDPGSAVVVGGGYIGLEVAEALLARGLQVTVVEMEEHPMASLDADMGELVADASGFGHVTETVRSTTRAGYHPGGSSLTVKVVAERRSGRLLGAQIVGEEGAGERIDVFATALWNGMTVDELINVDLSYAPPVAPLWDPVLIAARKTWQKTRTAA